MNRERSYFTSLLVLVLGACSGVPTAPTRFTDPSGLDYQAAVGNSTAIAVGHVVVEDPGVADGLGVTGENFRADLNFVVLEKDPARGHFRWSLRSVDNQRWRIVGTVEGDITSVTIVGNEAHLHGMVQRADGQLQSLVGEMFNAHMVDSGPNPTEPDRIHWHWGTGPCPCMMSGMDGGMGAGQSMMWSVDEGNLIVRNGGTVSMQGG